MFAKNHFKILIIILILFLSKAIYAKTLQFITFIHEPKQVYDRVRLFPHNSIDETEPCDIGTLYINESEDNAIKYCQDNDPISHKDGAWGPVPATWTQSGAANNLPILIFPTKDKNEGTNKTFVGIGTTTPEFRLHLDNDGGIWAEGSKGSGDDLPASFGAGTHLIWHPKKAAFRAGGIEEYNSDDTYWDDENIGDNSTALGLNTTASGDYSVALGQQTIAEGEASTAMGYLTKAEGDYSLAMGIGTTSSETITYNLAQGRGSIAMGLGTKALGDYSMAMGVGTIASSYASVAIGKYNSGLSGTTDSWQSADSVFEIGNGTDDLNRSNLLTILKDGRVGIGTDVPLSGLDVKNGPVCIHRYPYHTAGPDRAIKIGEYTNHTQGPDFKFAGNGILGTYRATYLSIDSENNSNDAAYYFGTVIDGSQPPSSSNMKIVMSIHETGDPEHPARVMIGGDKVPSYPFEMYNGVAQGAWCGYDGKWYNASSKEIKDNIKPLKDNDAFEIVENLSPITFSYKESNNKHHVGFIAEDVPELVASSYRHTLNAMGISASLTKVIQIQQTELDKQRKAIKAQKKELEILRQDLMSKIKNL